MAGKPQSLSKGQQDEVVKIFRQKILTWIIIALALLTGITGLSLWGIKNNLEDKLKDLVAKQFEEPRIQQVVNTAAETKAEALLLENINPEIDKFTNNLNNQQSKLAQYIEATQQRLTDQAISLENEEYNKKVWKK